MTRLEEDAHEVIKELEANTQYWKISVIRRLLARVERLEGALRFTLPYLDGESNYELADKARKALTEGEERG